MIQRRNGVWRKTTSQPGQWNRLYGTHWLEQFQKGGELEASDLFIDLWIKVTKETLQKVIKAKWSRCMNFFSDLSLFGSDPVWTSH